MTIQLIKDPRSVSWRLATADGPARHGRNPGQADAGAAAGQIPYQRPGGVAVLAQVRVCCDTPQEASVVDALASFGVVHADMPLTLANIWLAIQGPACSEGPARQGFP